MKKMLKNIFTRKISAVALTAVLLFASVFSVSLVANATSFSPRLTEPSTSNKYYYSDLNIYYKYEYGMPNCTAYAFGRAYEILGEEPNLSHGNACEWYDYNISNGYYDYGQTPKLGAIACWSGYGAGHVAVVEEINDGVVTLSNSAWSARYRDDLDTFYLTYGTSLSGYTFQGYIYIGDFGSSSGGSVTDSTEDSGDYVTGTYVTNVTDSLNMRSGAGTSFNWLASIPDGVTLEVTEIKTAGGYTWGHTSYNGTEGWVALDYCDYVSPSRGDDTEPTTLKAIEPTPTLASGYHMGDVDLDDVVDISDVTEVQKYVAKIVTLSDEQLELADFDGNGSIDVNDATRISKYLAGIISY